MFDGTDSLMVVPSAISARSILHKGYTESDLHGFGLPSIQLAFLIGALREIRTARDLHVPKKREQTGINSTSLKEKWVS
jgi:hypothetical protein